MDQGDKGSRKLTSRDFLKPCLVFLESVEMTSDARAVSQDRSYSPHRLDVSPVTNLPLHNLTHLPFRRDTL